MTEHFTKTSSGAKLVIMEGSALSVFSLESRTEWLIGREQSTADTGNMVALHSPIVSRNHGLLRKSGGAWHYYDNPANTNGTIYNGVKLKSSGGQPASVKLFDGDLLRVDKQSGGHSNTNAVLILFTTVPMENRWERFSIQGKQTVLIGRSPKCDIVQSLPYLSAKHAQITVKDGAYYLSDCGSKAGTYMNRRQVTKPVRLRDKDCFSLADRLFFLIGDSIYCTAGKTVSSSRTVDHPVILRANIHSKRGKNLSGPGTLELIRFAWR